LLIASHSLLFVVSRAGIPSETAEFVTP